eukprot:1965430-Alexandrium_andersonii.AAC.1
MKKLGQTRPAGLPGESRNQSLSVGSGHQVVGQPRKGRGLRDRSLPAREAAPRENHLLRFRLSSVGGATSCSRAGCQRGQLS